jgi:hypothetical protein
VAPESKGAIRVEHRRIDGAVPSPNDHRMWRLLLARLHPDAGGDHELFVFASTVKDSVCGKQSLEDKPVNHARPSRTSYSSLPQAVANPNEPVEPCGSQEQIK